MLESRTRNARKGWPAICRCRMTGAAARCSERTRRLTARVAARGRAASEELSANANSRLPQ
eukprot:9362598-Alexandrium_andersonii.AAC.1